ncbi:DUF4126 domain-containing protein [Plasticicumulans sp.]|uniref:DUF4126 domain-containing protein n=1 Tax=Plasticicumulans sp. TaxID=2307179 RepID=UPI003944988C|nr:DUF4126 domain-containing protein [Pseudomonadota bacterium]
MTAVDQLALALGAGWASGLNLYAAVLALGYFNATGDLLLPPELQILSDPLVMLAAGLMYCVEFFADKTPGVDSGWDALHTFLRIPAGAVLAAGAVGDVSPALQIAAGLVGGTLAAGTHFTKAGARVLINTSPEPFSNWAASVTEDVAVFAAIWTAVHHPALWLALLALSVALIVWLLPRLWRGIRRVLSSLARWFGGGRTPPADPPSLPPRLPPPAP